MTVFKCKICGGTLEISDGKSVALCEYCGTKQTVPTAKDEVITNLFNRANSLRLKCEFDKAEQVYEKILDIDNTDSEAHWGLVLCKYGIEYVEDGKANTKIPTCHRTLYGAVLTDVDYLAAIENADAEQKELYEAEAKVIDELQKNILNIVNNEEPFDVFICYKETDDDGKRTIDSSISNDIYYQLTQEGFKVFYAPITLEDKLGYEYEPYIFAALNSAKVMLVVGTKPEHFNSVWVRNEWSRYLKLMKVERSKLLIPCYKDMDAYELPDEFAHLQAQDMGKIGFISDVIRGLRKVINNDEQAQTTPDKKKKVRTSKFRRMADNLKRRRQEKKKYCLSFRKNTVAKFYYFFSLILNGYFLYEVVKLSTDFEWMMYLCVQLPAFLMPTLILAKKCSNKSFSIVIQGVSTIFCLLLTLGMGDLDYMISEGFYALTIFIATLNIPWFVLICLAIKIEKHKIINPDKKKTIIPATALSLALIIAFSSIDIRFCDYQLARFLYKVGAYGSASEYFLYLNDYKDSATLFNQSKLSEIKYSDNMDEVPLGHWVGGNSVYDNLNWDWWYIVSKEHDKVLLMKKYSVNIHSNRNLEGGWANSSIRDFLNNEYYETSFSEYIKERIIPTQLVSDSIETTDKIFLFSKEELESYFPFKYDRGSLFNCDVRLRNSNELMLNTGMFAYAGDEDGDGKLSVLERYKYGRQSEEYIPAMWIDISDIKD